MSANRRDPGAIRGRLADGLGPEVVAFALSLIVILAIAIAIGAGPFGGNSV